MSVQLLDLPVPGEDPSDCRHVPPDHRGAAMTEQGTTDARKARVDVDIRAAEEKLHALRVEREMVRAVLEERRRARVARIEQAMTPVDAAWQAVSAPIRSAVDRVWLWSARKLDALYDPMPCGCSWERVVDVSRGHRPGCEAAQRIEEESR